MISPVKYRPWKCCKCTTLFWMQPAAKRNARLPHNLDALVLVESPPQIYTQADHTKSAVLIDDSRTAINQERRSRTVPTLSLAVNTNLLRSCAKFPIFRFKVAALLGKGRVSGSDRRSSLLNHLLRLLNNSLNQQF